MCFRFSRNVHANLVRSVNDTAGSQSPQRPRESPLPPKRASALRLVAQCRTMVIVQERLSISVKAPRLPSRWYLVNLLTHPLVPETHPPRRENPVVVVAGLILVFAWYRRNKQRQSRDLSRTSTFPTPDTSHFKLKAEAETLSEPGFTSSVLPYRSPLVGILIRDPEPHLPQGHQPVYVESAAPRVPGVETGNYSIPNPNPGPLSSPSASSRTAPPPRGLSRVPTVQKETHFLGSHRDETGGNVVG